MSKCKNVRLYNNANGTSAETKADSTCVPLRDIENDGDTEDRFSGTVNEHSSANVWSVPGRETA